MKKENIVKYTGMGVLAATIILTASKNTNKIEKNNGYMSTNVHTGSISIAVPEGYHLEEGSKIVKNPKGLVNATYVPKEGYHLEQYDYDNNLFYVIQDGYHNENGYLIQDGWHLEGTTIKKDIVEVGFSRIRK